MAGKGWTDPCSKNYNGQINLGLANPPRRGSDHLQYIYVMHCPACVQNYGANGSDIWQRKCPHHQGGARGELLQGTEREWRPCTNAV